MAEQTSPMDLLKVVKGNKGLTAIAVGAALLLLFYLYRQSQAVAGATSASAPAATPTTGGFTPAQGTYTYVEDIHQGAGPTGPAGLQGPQGPSGPPIIVLPPSKTPPPVVKPPVKSPPVSSQGLLGPGIRFFPNYKNGLGYYRGPHTGGKIIPIPLPANTVYIPGPNGRVWYKSPPSSPQKLLTSG